MKFPRNSFLLLLRNEFRLYLRGIKGASVLFLVISQVLLHLVALSMAWGMSQRSMPAPSGSGLFMLAGGLIAMFMLMTSRALGNAVQVLYTRGDLDLLLSSPVDRHSVIGVRMGAIALTVALEVALLVWPFANVFVLFGQFAWAKAYMLVPAMALLATSVALAITLLSFRTLGPRRTRIVVQVLAVLVGMGIMLAVYLPRMLQSGPDHGMGTGPGRGPVSFTAGMEMLVGNGGYRELLLVPAQWVMQGFIPTVMFLVLAAGLLVMTIRLTGDSIVTALTTVAGVARRTTRRLSAASAPQFHRSFRAIIVLKELRLIRRDPFIIAQILQHSLAALPAAFALWRARIAGMPLSWAAFIVLAAGLAAPLAWLTITAEDAPDLLASAPVSRGALLRAKLEAALLPVLPICLVPLLFLLRTHPWFGFSMSFAAAGGALSAAVINMSNPMAKRRDSFKTRHQGNGGRGFLEVISLTVWVLVGVGLAWGGNKLAGWR